MKTDSRLLHKQPNSGFATTGVRPSVLTTLSVAAPGLTSAIQINVPRPPIPSPMVSIVWHLTYDSPLAYGPDVAAGDASPHGKIVLRHIKNLRSGVFN
ncbi:hypothetical protein KCP78_10870 [Salmonella enterica subsp. enterica]|nr:hypothetical protein KCP78_10870 [Salmonella enterica subsp. enterica]